eukprot:CAMPEP_0183383282 /NCGR_PEP_ID=MMETSP0164_2-20130417/127373_1 /TAXON_ID=221442 /ORGANISM="Coccolithus pelagicus ssp braarudi, Strain PLY182g" /LENGTH=108 /DNA_ID=CAMNT_0025560913 /DNA_START=556 /DNA_END=882 /DNA_ORIENTATION=-
MSSPDPINPVSQHDDDDGVRFHSRWQVLVLLLEQLGVSMGAGPYMQQLLPPFEVLHIRRRIVDPMQLPVEEVVDVGSARLANRPLEGSRDRDANHVLAKDRDGEVGDL